jgi:heme-degrading monooxygenase HmoA
MASRRPAVFAALLSIALGASSTVWSQERAMHGVMVEFDVATEQTEAVVATVRGLLSDLVRHQPGFIQARLNRQADGPKVVNYMVWESADAFAAFRAQHRERIGQAIGQYRPRFTFYNIELSVEAAR